MSDIQKRLEFARFVLRRLEDDPNERALLQSDGIDPDNAVLVMRETVGRLEKQLFLSVLTNQEKSKNG